MLCVIRKSVWSDCSTAGCSPWGARSPTCSGWPAVPQCSQNNVAMVSARFFFFVSKTCLILGTFSCSLLLDVLPLLLEPAEHHHIPRCELWKADFVCLVFCFSSKTVPSPVCQGLSYRYEGAQPLRCFAPRLASPVERGRGSFPGPQSKPGTNPSLRLKAAAAGQRESWWCSAGAVGSVARLGAEGFLCPEVGQRFWLSLVHVVE